MTPEHNPERPNDPLRVVEPFTAWPPGQPPVTPIGPWTGSIGGIDRAWYWRPELLDGYVAKMMRLELHVRDVSGPGDPVFSTAVSPQMLMAFLDPNDDDTPTQNQEFQGPLPDALPVPPAPVGCEVLFFALAGVVDIVNATNNGNGYEFPMRTPGRYYGIWVSALAIVAAAEVTITPVIEYVKIGVGQGR